MPRAGAHAIDPELIEQRLRQDSQRRIKAVCVVHSETSTGFLSDIAAVRRAIDAAQHPALLLVDTISGLGCADYRHDEWGVDVSVSGSQKGLMLPPGISFNGTNHQDQQGCICPKNGLGYIPSQRTASASAKVVRRYEKIALGEVSIAFLGSDNRVKSARDAVVGMFKSQVLVKGLKAWMSSMRSSQRWRAVTAGRFPAPRVRACCL